MRSGNTLIPGYLVAALASVVCLPLSAAHGQVEVQPRFRLPRTSYTYSKPQIQEGLQSSGLTEVENTPSYNPITDEGAALGRVLFYDKRLSLNERISCASCHKQRYAFADRRPASKGFRGRRTRRNSMGLANLAYYSSGRFFWDERADSLEEMVLMPIQDQIEMGLELGELVRRLKWVWI